MTFMVAKTCIGSGEGVYSSREHVDNYFYCFYVQSFRQQKSIERLQSLITLFIAVMNSRRSCRP